MNRIPTEGLKQEEAKLDEMAEDMLE